MPKCDFHIFRCGLLGFGKLRFVRSECRRDQNSCHSIPFPDISIHLLFPLIEEARLPPAYHATL